MNKQKLIRTLLLSSILIIPFIFFSSKKQPWKYQPKSISWIQEIIFTIEYSIHNAATRITNTVSTYINLTKTAQENLLLKQKINALNTAMMGYQSHVKENNRLRKLLNFTTGLLKHILLV